MKTIMFLIGYLAVFTFMPIFAETTMNGTIFGTNTAQIQITSPVTVGGIENDGIGITTTQILDGSGSREYTFDRINSNNIYSVYWNSISNTEIDFTVATLGLTDVRTTTTGSLLGSVHIDNVNTPFTYSPNLNTILVNIGKFIQEFFPNGGNPNQGSITGSTQAIQPSLGSQPTQINITSQVITTHPSTIAGVSIPFYWNSPNDISVSSVSIPDNSLFSISFNSLPAFNASPSNITQAFIPLKITIPDLCTTQNYPQCVNVGQYFLPITIIFSTGGLNYTGTTNLEIDIVTINQQPSIPYEDLEIILIIFIISVILIFYFKRRKSGKHSSGIGKRKSNNTYKGYTKIISGSVKKPYKYKNKKSDW